MPTILRLIIISFYVGLATFSSAQARSAAAIPYGHNKAVGTYADVDGIRLYYEVYGHGQPLLLIHGNGDSIAGMAAQIAYFSKNYQVIVADSRGHGKSGLGKTPLTYIQMMTDLNALLNRLKIRHADIFGWSDGGILGLLLAINHPDKVGRLAIMGANLRPDETAVEPWVAPILKGYARKIKEMMAKKDSSKDWNLQWQRLKLLMTQPNIKTVSLHRITAPVLVIAGDRDVIRAQHTLEIFRNLKNAQLAILPGHTHFAPVLDPVMFNKLLSNFFNKPFKKPSTRAIMQQQYVSFINATK
ncbi:MAG: alpha/beta hydrolase [Alphaproteobacteria bacterium]|nr:alpha/beta hydrolase [Alphaproteobacteria bacterium]